MTNDNLKNDEGPNSEQEKNLNGVPWILKDYYGTLGVAPTADNKPF